MSETAIKAAGLGFVYHGTQENALQNVGFAAEAGQCIVLCGRSGCGKTTLTRILNGLSPAFFAGELSGECRTFGLEAGKAAIEDYVPLVGSVFQNPKTQYFNTNTTAELAFPCENAGVPPEQIRARVADCAARFGLDELLGRNIFNLSGGEKQRIAFGAAAMLAPKLLVLDEPTSNLDAGAIEALRKMILQMKAEGTTIVLAEHRLAWTLDFADRYYYFVDGELREKYTAAEFAALPDAELAERGLRPTELAPFRAQLKAKIALSPPADTPLLQANQLTVGYNRRNPVYTVPEFALHKGEIVGLMGPNGVGKSTLTKTLCGLLKPLGGSLLWQGCPVKPKELIRHSFLVMQDVNFQLFSDSVREEILLGAAEPERCDEVLAALDLLPLANRHPMSLSGGQKQRTAIASAMLSGKDIIFMDEPTSGLDRCSMQQVGQLLLALKAQGKAVLVITHDEELAAGWCDRVITLKRAQHAKEGEAYAI